MSNQNEAIRLAGRAVTILRTGGNVSTYMYDAELGDLPGKRRPDPFFDFEVGMLFPTDSTITEGDLIQAGSEYFLTMSVAEKRLGNILRSYRGMLYRCNAVVSIKNFSGSSIATGVHCLITQARVREQDEDKALIERRNKGRTQPFQLFMRDSEGLIKTSYIEDASSRRFRVSKQFDPFIAGGIVQAELMWENV